MTTLELDRHEAGRAAERPGFLRRQFSPTSRPEQKMFDVLFGIVAPILCFVFDPLVFKSAGFGAALVPDYQAFVYLVSGVEILFLIIWLVCGRQLQSATRLAGGILMAGAMFSGLIGVLLLPFTLMGLVLVIGVFGFVPFLTALVYLRNANSAFQLAATPSAGRGVRAQQREVTSLGPAQAWMGATIIGCALTLGLPAALSFVVSTFVSQAMNAVLSTDERQANLAIDQIKYLQFFAPPEADKLVVAYQGANEQSRKEQLKRRYLRLTGNNIEERLRVLAD